MIRLGAGRWNMYRHRECEDCRLAATLRNRSAAQHWLRQFKGNSAAMNALRQMLSQESTVSLRLDRATDDDIIDQAALMLSRGEWHIHGSHGSHGLPGAQSGGAGPGKQTDGADARGRESGDAASGRASLAGAGLATASSRSQAQRSVDLNAAKELTWIEIQLLDADGKPVTGMPYEIKLPDGSVRTGTLDAVGMARHEEIVAGQCEVRFPGLDGGDWKPA